MNTILFYTPGTCALACMVSLEWLREPYRLCRVEREARSSQMYRAINPRAQVPALRVDGRTLVEANAILAHIADRRPAAGLLPANETWERDVANQWLAYLASGFHPAFWPYFRPDRYTTDSRHEMSVKEGAERSIRRELSFVDRNLEGRDWIVGDRRTVLDVYLHSMDRWAKSIVDMALEFPNVARHQNALQADRSVRFALAIERDADADISESSCIGHVALAQLEE